MVGDENKNLGVGMSGRETKLGCGSNWEFQTVRLAMK